MSVGMIAFLVSLAIVAGWFVALVVLLLRKRAGGEVVRPTTHKSAVWSACLGLLGLASMLSAFRVQTTASAPTARKDIFVMNASASGTMELTSRYKQMHSLAWSPDGKKIVFLSRPPSEFYDDVHVMNADGSGRKNLTTSPSSANETHPRWSPDGRRIVFARPRGGDNEVCAMNPDGSDQISLSPEGADDHEPEWSPDGRRIAFARRTYRNTDIWVANVDGTGQSNLSSNAGDNGKPVWSPDGAKIAFEHEDNPTRGELERSLRKWAMLERLFLCLVVLCGILGPPAVWLGIRSLQGGRARILGAVGLLSGAASTIFFAHALWNMTVMLVVGWALRGI